MKSGNMRLAVNVADMGEIRSVYRIFVGKLRGRRALGMLGEDERIILKLVLKK
jgi:hypothetical protein